MRTSPIDDTGNGLPPWSGAQRVRVRGRVWDVREYTRFADCGALRLSRFESPWASETSTLLVPFDRPQPIAAAQAVKVLRLRRWVHALRRRTLSVQPFGSLTAAAHSAVQILPYQLEPALAILRHAATRVLIADGVGLGKTIQAGLILNEIATRREDARALVVTPAGLCDQWRRELRVHFGLDAVTADAAWIARASRDLPPDVNPWMLPGIHVVSIDLVKRPEILRPLHDVIWDVVVVDEAHGAAPGTERRAAVHAIALRSRRVVLLTATPHTGDADHFEALCRIGAFDGTTEPMLIFRRTRNELRLPLRRRSRLMAIRLSGDEVRMHRLLEDYSVAVAREAAARRDARARLAAIILRKRALSSAACLARSVERRLAFLVGEAVLEHQLRLPLMDDEPDDETPDEILAVPGLADAPTECEWLRRIAAAAHAASPRESKMRFLLRWLGRLHEPAIVFTEYRDTLADLARHVEARGARVLTLHGGLSARERTDVQTAFNEHGGVLLATDAAAEGLNLHGQCRAILHYELPWTPLRLEQRAGRVDRIGQSRTVHEIALVAHDTAERLVLAPLLRRAAEVRASLGAHHGALEAIPESRIAAAVLDGRSLDDVPSSGPQASGAIAGPDPGLGDDANVEAARLVARRAAIEVESAASVRGSEADHICLVSSCGRRAVSSLIAIAVLRLVTPLGTTVHAEVKAAVLAEEGRQAGRSRSQLRSVIPAWLAEREGALRATFESDAGLRLDDISDRHRRNLEALEERERAIRALVAGDARTMVQGGLFDRRAERHADERQRTTASVLEELDQRCHADPVNRTLKQEIEWCAVLVR